MYKKRLYFCIKIMIVMTVRCTCWGHYCLEESIKLCDACRSQRVSRFGLAVRRYAGKWEDLGSIPLRFSFRGPKRLWFVDTVL